jgi:hypothetical protein
MGAFINNIKGYHFLKSSLKPLKRRYFNQQINLIPENNILFFGDPRGGTTWMGETLSQLFNLPILWEPMLPRKDSRFKNFNFASRQYLPENLNDKAINQAFSDLFTGKGIDDWEIQHTSVKMLKQSQAAVIKFTRGTMLLPYITENFKFNKKPIYMLRHPMAVVASQLKHVGWREAKPYFEIPNAAFNEVYVQHRDFLNTLKTKEEILIAKWALTNKVVLEHPKHQKHWIFITYEETLLNPKETLQKVLDAWGCAEVNLDQIDFSKKSRTSSSLEKIGKEQQLSQWRNSFSVEQILKMQAVLDYFEIDIYNSADSL